MATTGTENTTATTAPPVFINSFEGEGEQTQIVDSEQPRKSSKDHTQTDEWDASKTVPSRFQQRKGSIFATPSSRDGHVQRNRDANDAFHEAHSRRWSLTKPFGISGRRKSSAGEKDSVKPQ